jgi:cell wall assembly regulator SMI1
MIKPKRMRWMEAVRNVYKILVGKPEGKRPLGRPRCRWEDNTRMDLREIELECVDWIDVAQDRDSYQVLVYMVMNLGLIKTG